MKKIYIYIYIKHRELSPVLCEDLNRWDGVKGYVQLSSKIIIRRKSCFFFYLIPEAQSLFRFFTN